MRKQTVYHRRPDIEHTTSPLILAPSRRAASTARALSVSAGVKPVAVRTRIRAAGQITRETQNEHQTTSDEIQKPRHRARPIDRAIYWLSR